jgi:NAD(P)-dependent dehydrogenase (short-subunit alcohol dehydrogenase family)
MAALTQLFPPSPTFTEKELPSLAGKVFIVTGGNSGVGFELVKILYSKGGTVYIACRSPNKIGPELEEIKAAATTTPGQIKTLRLDLADLATIGPCVSAFLNQESRLDVLWNNAGVTQAAPGTVTAQGHEVHIGTNSLGHFLLTQLLLPTLIETAGASPRGSVRIVFATSGVVELQGPPGGFDLSELEPSNHSKDKQRNYSASKAGCWFLASEFDRRLRKHGVVCLAPSPGTLRTKGWDNAPWAMRTIMRPFMHEPRMGAYTELWAGLSPTVSCNDGGQFVIPWGRLHPSPKREIVESLKTIEEGGTGLAAEFWNWCQKTSEGFSKLVD